MIKRAISYLFGTQESASKIVDTVSNGIDKLVYTDEEKADAAAKDRAAARGMLVGWMRESSGQNVARRFIAISLTMLWGVIYGAKIVLSVAAPFLPSYQVAMMVSAKALEVSAHEMNGAMMLILGFYFAAPHMDKFISPFIERFGASKVDKQAKQS